MTPEASRPCRPARECQGGTGCESDNGRVKRRVQTLSCGLAEVTASSDTQVVQFIHQSVKDFLVEKGLSALQSGLTSTGLAIEMAHRRLSSTATTAIVLGTSRTGSPPTPGVLGGASCSLPTAGFPGLASLSGVHFDNDVGYLLMPKLPWFRLQQLLRNRGVQIRPTPFPRRSCANVSFHRLRSRRWRLRRDDLPSLQTCVGG